MRTVSLSLLACLSLVACKPAGDGAKTDAKDEAVADKATGGGAKGPTRAEVRAEQAQRAEGSALACAEAFAALDTLDRSQASDTIDGAKLVAAIRDQSTALTWLTGADERLGRMNETRPEDVALIEEWLTKLEVGSDQAASQAAGIATQLRAVAFLDMRRMLGEVADDRVRGEQAREEWTKAACLWKQALAPLAERADALEAEGGESWTGKWTETIQAGFNAGARAIGSDATAVKVAKQQIEKSLYAVMFRLIIDNASKKEAAAASEAYGLLDALEDRLSTRNSPGLRRMRAQLSGPPESIDSTLFERELAVAFTKRARKYCDKAALGGEVGQPDAIAETWEGIVYTRVVLALMRDALEPKGFDADSYLSDWDLYLEAVKGADGEGANEVSPRLVEWNCAYQTHLGIAECTSADDETE